MDRSNAGVALPALGLVACLALAACGGGSSDPTPVTIAPLGAFQGLDDDIGDGVESTEDGSPRSRLRVDSRRLCQDAGATFELPVSLVDPPTADTAGADTAGADALDVSARVVPTPSLGDSLEILGQGDGALSLRLSRRDVIRLRLDLDDSRQANGLTVYLAAFTPDTPRSVLMRKRVSGGCTYALRLPDVEFCGATRRAHGTGEPAPTEFGSSGISVSLDGCDFTLPPGVSFVELPPEPGADIGAP